MINKKLIKKALVVTAVATMVLSANVFATNVVSYAAEIDYAAQGFIIENKVLKSYTGTATEVVIPDGVTKIEESAFANKSTITKITIPTTVTEIGKNAFAGCTGLTNVVLLEGLVKIGEAAFYDCSSLTSITIPSTVNSVSIYGNVFGGNCGLVNVTFAGTRTEIPEHLFEGTNSLQSITIPDTIVKIGTNAFNGCTGLREVVIPEGVEELGHDVFYGCSNLKSVTIPSTLQRVSLYGNNFKECGKLNKIKFSGTPTAIADYLFMGTESIRTIKFPSTIESIGKNAFEGCNSITTLVIPASVRTIGSNAFSNCATLKEVYINNGVTKIDGGAFADCAKLTKIIIPPTATTFDSMWAQILSNSNAATIFCKQDSAAHTYATTNNIPYILFNNFTFDYQRIMVKSFVSRMYTVVLNRDAETEGLNFWTQALLTGEYEGQPVTGSIVAKMFIEGDEFKARELNDEDFIKVMYQAIMDRDADNDGLEMWLDVLSNGVSRTFILQQFMGSEEFSDICEDFEIQKGSIELTENRDKNYGVTSFVQRFYTKTLERTADVEGINTWTGAILAKQLTPAQAASYFVFSDEANAMGRTDAQFVYMMYRTFMGRECEDEATCAVWTGYLSNHTRQNMFDLFAGSTEFTAIVASYGL